MNKYDKLSIGLTILAIILSIAFIFSIPFAQRSLINILSIIGSITSPVGLTIAIIQLLKIENSSSTYQRTFAETIKSVVNNNIISRISRSFEQIKLIQHYMQLKQFPSSISHFNNLMLDLVYISTSEKATDFNEKINEFITFCATTEAEIIQEKQFTMEYVTESYSRLLEIQRFLTEIESIYNKPQK
ncbi:MAG: hypothetical protein JWO92_493 [Chitinophagaceae bacterium]|nr:hypothetical protein [Chitinophagaceae bacterium]